jgi:hypothetical protein
VKEPNKAITGLLQPEYTCVVADWDKEVRFTALLHHIYNLGNAAHGLLLFEEGSRARCGRREWRLAGTVLKSAILVSKRLEGQRVPAAARRGDFIPENILLGRNNVGVRGLSELL